MSEMGYRFKGLGRTQGPGHAPTKNVLKNFPFRTRLDYHPLFGKGARAPPANSSVLLGEERRPGWRKQRKSGLLPERQLAGQWEIRHVSKTDL